jgi:lipoprotein-anchoring transpeptidase ErfK/SrfK
VSTTGPNSTSRQSRRWLAAITALAVAIAAGVIVAGVLITSGGGGKSGTTAAFSPVAPGTATSAKRGALSPSSSLAPAPGTLVAVVLHSTTLRSAPGGAAIHRLTTHTDFGSPEVLWVVKRSSGWLGVVSPLAGNGRLGWIPDSSAALNHVTWELKVSLSARRLTVIDNGKVLERYTVAVGAPGSPTPTGRFAVTDRLATGDPAGPYGCCIVALSARSPHTIQGWTGGDRIAIHSTPETASIGQAVSHGCVRLTLAEGQWLMNHVPLGTPTLISS